MSYQYRVTINNTEFPVVDSLPSRWAAIAQGIEDRGGIAILERRLITDYDENWVSGLKDAEGLMPSNYMRLGNKVITAWEVLAAMECR